MSEKNNKTNQSNPSSKSQQPTKPIRESGDISQENYSGNNKPKRGPNPPVNRTSQAKPQKK